VVRACAAAEHAAEQALPAQPARRLLGGARERAVAGDLLDV
jgi:hypothetical protein